MATFDTGVCNKALKLLRQDEEISGSTGSPVAVKCAALYDLAYNAVATAHEWQTAMSGSVPTDPAQLRLLIYSLARELAIPVTGRAQDFEMMSMAYNQALAEYVKRDIHTRIASTDPILAQLVSNYAGKDADLPYTYSVYSNRVTAVKTASENEVKKTLGFVAGTALDDLAASAAETLTVAKLAPAFGLDANFVQLKIQEYMAKLTEWRKLKLNEALAVNTDTALAQLVANFRSDDAGLVNAFTVYTARVSAVKTSSENEVKKTLGITLGTGESLDDLAASAVDNLVVAKLAPACGLDANFVQLKMQEYATKILEWRKLKLNEALASNTDGILALVLGNFRGDDPGLVNAFTVYTARLNSVKATAAKEIEMAQEWSSPFVSSGTVVTTHLAYPAYEYLCASKIAPVCGCGADFVAMLGKKYAEALLEAKNKDLEDALKTETDTDLIEIFSHVRMCFRQDNALEWSWASIKRRYTAIKESCRQEILSAHAWHMFMRTADVASSEDGNGVYRLPLPGDLSRMVQAYGMTGEHVLYTRQGDVLVSDRPIVRIVYQSYRENFTDWTGAMRLAYVLRIAQILSWVMPNETLAQQSLRAEYEKALSDAKAQDAKESRPSSASAVRHNRYSEAMAGGLRPLKEVKRW